MTLSSSLILVQFWASQKGEPGRREVVRYLMAKKLTHYYAELIQPESKAVQMLLETYDAAAEAAKGWSGAEVYPDQDDRYRISRFFGSAKQYWIHREGIGEGFYSSDPNDERIVIRTQDAAMRVVQYLIKGQQKTSKRSNFSDPMIEKVYLPIEEICTQAANRIRSRAAEAERKIHGIFD